MFLKSLKVFFLKMGSGGLDSRRLGLERKGESWDMVPAWDPHGRSVLGGWLILVSWAQPLLPSTWNFWHPGQGGAGA